MRAAKATAPDDVKTGTELAEGLRVFMARDELATARVIDRVLDCFFGRPESDEVIRLKVELDTLLDGNLRKFEDPMLLGVGGVLLLLAVWLLVESVLTLRRPPEEAPTA